MEDKPRYTVGDFIYEPSIFDDTLDAVEYVGPTGPGSVAIIPASCEVEGHIYKYLYEYDNVLENIFVEEVVSEGKTLDKLRSMPILRKVVFECEASRPIKLIDTTHPVTVEYTKGIREFEPFTKYDEFPPIATTGNHAVFGDEVKAIGIVQGGHITLGKNVKSIFAMKKAQFGIEADCSVADYELPTRIDFRSAEPPVIGSLAPGAISITEIHVPKGALEAYISHPQWGKAAYIVEEGGATIDNYAAKHKARLKKLKKEAEKAIETAKEEKVKALSESTHIMLAQTKLAPWNPEIKEDERGFEITVYVGSMTINLEISKEAPISVWDTLAEKLSKCS